MKVTDWRRKLAASLVAGGLLSPVAAVAANLNTNLVTNPSFENIDLDTNAVLDWNDGTETGFAYAYGLYYDAGGPLAGGGDYYFTPVGSLTGPGQVAQNIDVSTGATAAQIASGEAAVTLNAYFTTYPFVFDENDRANLHVEFLDAGGISLGSTLISAKAPVVAWQQASGAEFIPIGTATLRTSLYTTAGYFGGDGYTDLVDVQVAPAADELLFIEVDTISGEVAIMNQTGAPIHIDFYEISAAGPTGDYNGNGVVDAADYTVWRDNLDTDVTLPNDSTPGEVTTEDYDVWKAAFGMSGSSLDATDWESLQEQNLTGFPPGNGTGNGWEQAGGSDASLLSESFLTGNSIVSNGEPIPLGAAFNPGSSQNLEFRYGLVADDGAGGFTGSGTFVRGFVRYVGLSAGAGQLAVPEPSSVVLIGIGLASLSVGGARSKRE